MCAAGLMRTLLLRGCGGVTGLEVLRNWEELFT